jgi:hypothetical protein
MTQSAVWRIGLVGHRDITDPNDIEAIRKEASDYFCQWNIDHPRIEVITLLAVGSDMILTKVALEYNAQLFLVVPYGDYEHDFSPEELEEYWALRSQATAVENLPAQQKEKETYKKAGYWIVEHADILLAVWDGAPAHGLGGTEDVVTYAQQLSKPVFIIQKQRTPRSGT